MNTYKIMAKAPTVYQLKSLRHFGMEIINAGGSYYSEQEFETEDEAKSFLIDRAELYYDEFYGQIDEHLEGIDKYGMLTIDAVTARIQEVEEELSINN